MKLIVGLGNPGIWYAHSRHNIGSSIIKGLAQHYKLALKKDNAVSALSAKADIEGHLVVVAVPGTFMNLSGNAVGALLRKYRVNLSDLLIVCDDLDLEFGRLRIKACGSSGGQRGLKSIIDSLKSQEFARLRVGIDRPGKSEKVVSDYVLSSFSRAEKKQLDEVTAKAIECCQMWVRDGIDVSMNVFNKKEKKQMKGKQE
ncbi:MAG: aminoacyl-tRNA hydrolase [Candidatus Omnitrophota bacterium]|jgi:PTH1 family peptidyl-tRNA hydrolase